MIDEHRKAGKTVERLLRKKDLHPQLAQDALDNAETIYIEPFEPYTVADFIGRMRFVYE